MLLKLIIFFQNATISLLKYEANKKADVDFEQQIGINGDKKYIWIDVVNNCDLDQELKKEVKSIEIQSKNVINISKEKTKFQDILSKCED